jgi:hypothetical protein
MMRSLHGGKSRCTKPGVGILLNEKPLLIYMKLEKRDYKRAWNSIPMKENNELAFKSETLRLKICWGCVLRHLFANGQEGNYKREQCILDT